MRVALLPLLAKAPTAQTPPPGIPVAPAKPLALLPGLGVVSIDHWPSTSCSIRLE
jgi:hypothetical protein